MQFLYYIFQLLNDIRKMLLYEHCLLSTCFTGLPRGLGKAEVAGAVKECGEFLCCRGLRERKRSPGCSLRIEQRRVYTVSD